MPYHYYSNGTASAPFDMQDLLSAVDRLRAIPKPDTLLMHPRTYDKIKAAMGVPENYELIPDVSLCDLVPENDLQTRWVPPPAGRFTELTASDESWARPLGLGHLETVDLGPVIYRIKSRLRDLFKAGLFSPLPMTGIYGNP